MRKQLVLFFLGAFCAANAQDPHFNNLHQTLVHFNPSYAGSSEHWRSQTVYRNQWPGLSGTYVTYNTCVDGYIDAIKGGLAFSVLSEDQDRGTLRRTNVALTYAQYIKLSEDLTLIPSVQGSYNRSTLDKGRLNFGDPIDRRYGIYWKNTGFISPWGIDIPNYSVTYYNTQVGLIVKYGKHFNAGASFANVLKPNISHLGRYRLPIRTNLHLQHTGPFSRRSSMEVAALLTVQNSYYSARLNVIHKFDKGCGLLYGAGYGINNAYVMPVGYSNDAYHSIRGFIGYSKKVFGITYSYDQYLMGKSHTTAGSHEISLSVVFAKRGNNK